MDVEDLVKSYFRLGFSNKEILCLLAHQHGVIISKRTLQRLCRKLNLEEKIRQTLRKLPLLCSLRWRPVVDSKDIDGYICVLFEEDMLKKKSKKSTLKELNFDVSEYAIMPQRVGTPAEVLATSETSSAPKFNSFRVDFFDHHPHSLLRNNISSSNSTQM